MNFWSFKPQAPNILAFNLEFNLELRMDSKGVLKVPNFVASGALQPILESRIG
jgi:hypothetical protein